MKPGLEFEIFLKPWDWMYDIWGVCGSNKLILLVDLLNKLGIWRYSKKLIARHTSIIGIWITSTEVGRIPLLFQSHIVHLFCLRFFASGLVQCVQKQVWTEKFYPMSLRTYGEANKHPVFHVGDAWRRNIPWVFIWWKTITSFEMFESKLKLCQSCGFFGNKLFFCIKEQVGNQLW